MKIMSFNTQHCENFITRKIDFSAVAECIRSFDPDIVGLNEIRGVGEHPDYTAQTEELARLSGMPHYRFVPATYIDHCGPYGNAILSKIPFTAVEGIAIPEPDDAGKKYYEPRGIIQASFESGLSVLITHMGLTDIERKNAVSTLIQHIKAEKCILMGDFNATPDDPVLAPIKAKMTDTAIAFGEPLLSFDSIAPTAKIDYIFASSDMTIKSADIPARIVSDHRPYITELLFTT